MTDEKQLMRQQEKLVQIDKVERMYNRGMITAEHRVERLLEIDWAFKEHSPLLH